MEKTIGIALIGTGWAGQMHAVGYGRVIGLSFQLRTVCSLDEGLEEFAKTYHFETWTNDFDRVLCDPTIQVVDIVTPPVLHARMVEKALRAGKHVICEKPLTGYFGEKGTLAGKDPRRIMIKQVYEELKKLEQVAKESGRLLCYAENWIYSPPFTRAVELVLKKQTTLLNIYGFTGHKGSHAEHAARWSANGGGTLIRQGSHPIAAALYLKRKEMENRGEIYGVRSVWCDCACITDGWTEEKKRSLHTQSIDVEDWAQLIITFTDNTKACITSGDFFLSQIYNSMVLFGNDAVYRINMTPNNLLEVYFSDDTDVKDEAIMEKNDQNIGWQHKVHPFVKTNFF